VPFQWDKICPITLTLHPTGWPHKIWKHIMTIIMQWWCTGKVMYSTTTAVSFMFWPLYLQRKSLMFPLDRRLGRSRQVSEMKTCSCQEFNCNHPSYALSYGLDDRGSRVRFPVGAGNFPLHHHMQNSSGAHPAFYPIGTWGSFPGFKAAEAWSWLLTSI
jgi:hypothetical protein